MAHVFRPVHNLRQIGIALHHHHDVRGYSARFTTGGSDVVETGSFGGLVPLRAFSGRVAGSLQVLAPWPSFYETPRSCR
jgi:hypothetical protein